MEKLYNRGYISYPRTESSAYDDNVDLQFMVKNLIDSAQFGSNAKKMYEGQNYAGPRKGKSLDKFHPPIHTVKVAHSGELGG